MQTIENASACAHCAQLELTIASLRAALDLFVVHCTYPVSTEINPRGYAWRDERALDYAFGEAVKVLGAYEQKAGD